MLCYIVDRWRDAVSPGSPPFASDDVDLLPCNISLDFPFHVTYRGLNVPGAKAPGIKTAPLFFLFLAFAYAISIAPCGGRRKKKQKIFRFFPKNEVRRGNDRTYLNRPQVEKLQVLKLLFSQFKKICTFQVLPPATFAIRTDYVSWYDIDISFAVGKLGSGPDPAKWDL